LWKVVAIYLTQNDFQVHSGLRSSWPMRLGG